MCVKKDNKRKMAILLGRAKEVIAKSNPQKENEKDKENQNLIENLIINRK